jgi:hypothetical protein
MRIYIGSFGTSKISTSKSLELEVVKGTLQLRLFRRTSETERLGWQGIWGISEVFGV